MFKFSFLLCATVILASASAGALAEVHLQGFSVGGSSPTPPATPTGIPTHSFDFLFEDGFNCTDLIAPGTDLPAFFAALPAGGHTVCIQAGTYTLNAPISVPSNTNIRGAGQGSNRAATTLVVAPGVNDQAINIIGKTNVSVSHLKIDGNGANQPQNFPAGVFVWQSGGVTLKDLDVGNTAAMDIISRESSYVTISSSYLHDMHRWTATAGAVGAFWISGPAQSSIWVNDNYVVGNANGPGGDGGIDCYGTDQIAVYNNTIVNTGESSIYTATPGCTNFSIWGNDIHNSNEWGIDITLGANNVQILSNLVDGTADAAMVLWQVSNITVQYNTMRNGHTPIVQVPCKSIVVDSSTSRLLRNSFLWQNP